MYSSFWQALSRYDPDRFMELLQEMRTSREAVQSVASIPRLLSRVPLQHLLNRLYPLKSYASIARLAGQIAYAQSAPRRPGKRLVSPQSSRLPAVVAQALKQLAALMPDVHFHQARRGSGGIFHIRGLPFVTPGLGKPTCGFVSGFVGAALTMNNLPRLRVEEEACVSATERLRACVFEAGGGIVESWL